MMAPWDDRAEETEVPEDMARYYWVDVTNGVNVDYDDIAPQLNNTGAKP